MREYSIVLREDLQRGLRTYREMGSGHIGTHLSELSGLVPGEVGLKTPTSFDPLGSSLPTSFPFPMVFRSTENHVTVTESSVIIGTTMPTVDLEDNPVSFTFTDVPHFVDLGRSWLITDGGVIVFRQNPEGVLGPVRCLTSPKVLTACYHKGRVLMGGTSQVYNIWSEDSDKLVFWSSIGGGDAFEPFLGELLDSEEKAYRHLEENLIGWCNPGVGKVMHLHALGPHVVVFGEIGLALLTYNREGPGAYGQAKILDIGVKDRNSVAGDGQSAFFIDMNNDLWVIDSELKLQKLGYREFLEVLLGPVLTYISGLRELYITDGLVGYVLTPNGFSSSPHKITSVLPVSGNLQANHLSESDEFSLTIDSPDFATSNNNYMNADQVPGFKKLTFIQVNGEGLKDLYVQVTVLGDTNYTLPVTPCNNSQVGYSGASGRRFKIQVFGKKDSEHASINSIVLRFQSADHRSFRSGD